MRVLVIKELDAIKVQLVRPFATSIRVTRYVVQLSEI